MLIEPGQLIFNGEYRIESLIGEGAFAEVYKATDLGLSRLCAVKILRRDREGIGSTDYKDFIDRFMLEARLGASIAHPNVIAVYRFSRQDDMLALSMAYAAGRSLADKIANARNTGELLTIDVCVRIATEVARGLAALHERDAVHRDLKPSNILFDAQGVAQVADLGLVEMPGGPSMRSRLSNASLHPGTPSYMSPEQRGGTDHLAPASDVYALGLVLFEMLTGRLYRNVKPGTTARSLRAEVPAELDEVLERMLQRYAEQRPWDGEEAAKLLQEYPEANQRRQREAEQLLAAEKRAEAERIETQRKARVEADRIAREKTAEEARQLEIKRVVAEKAAEELRQREIERLVAEKVAEELRQLEIKRMAADKAAEEARQLEIKRMAADKAAAESRKVATGTGNLLLTLAPGVTLDLVRIPAGEFLMGSKDADSNESDEKPQHKLRLDEYLIGKYAVTNGQFAAYVKATGYKTTAEKGGSGYIWTDKWEEVKGADWQHPRGPNSNISGKEKHPVVQVSWDDAVAFCAWVKQTTGRQVQLPTEAQWEKAARGTEGRIYPWGNEAPNANLANFNMNVKDTTEVGKYSPTGDSPYGLADMAGNVWEWTADWYSDTYYASSPSSNPQGPTTGQYRVLRGGGWSFDSNLVRAAYRLWNVPSVRSVYFGFRVVVSAPVS